MCTDNAIAVLQFLKQRAIFENEILCRKFWWTTALIPPYLYSNCWLLSSTAWRFMFEVGLTQHPGLHSSPHCQTIRILQLLRKLKPKRSKYITDRTFGQIAVASLGRDNFLIVSKVIRLLLLLSHIKQNGISCSTPLGICDFSADEETAKTERRKNLYNIHPW